MLVGTPDYVECYVSAEVFGRVENDGEDSVLFDADLIVG